MWRYFIILILSLFVFGCDFDSGFDSDYVIVEPVDVPAEVIPEDKEVVDFPGSVIVTGEKADKVIEGMESEYWLSDSNTLHNSLCRWYKKCSGKVWNGTDSYENCKNCGGSSPIVREWNINEEGENE